MWTEGKQVSVLRLGGYRPGEVTGLQSPYDGLVGPSLLLAWLGNEVVWDVHGLAFRCNGRALPLAKVIEVRAGGVVIKITTGQGAPFKPIPLSPATRLSFLIFPGSGLGAPDAGRIGFLRSGGGQGVSMLLYHSTIVL